MMKLVIFDVGNAACSLAVCPNGYSLMVDCGSHSDKPCPVDQIKQLRKYLGMKQYNGHDLTLLHITHPHDDHVKNAKKVKEELPPYLVHRRKYEVFPKNEDIHKEYKKYIDKKYRGDPIKFKLWGFDQNKPFKIPMNVILKDEELSKKIKNNSSIIRFIEYAGRRILFGGDLEKPGWDWLIKNNHEFVDTIKDGIDVLIAPHHGHKSGFPTSLFELVGNVEISILSKASESEKEDSDISSQYSKYSNGIYYINLADEQIYFASGTLTTRSNGSIFITIEKDGGINIITEKASSNHQIIR